MPRVFTKKSPYARYELWVFLLLVSLGTVGYLYRLSAYEFALESTVSTVSVTERNPLHSQIKQVQCPFPGGGTREAWVYLPSGYNLTQTSYPTLYLLHGSPGNDNDWLVRGNARQALDQEIRNKQLPATIVVFPNGNSSNSDETQYLNSTDKKELNETFISHSLVASIDKSFRTDPTRRAIGGLSSGGFGALNIGLKNQQTFGQIISFSGYAIPLHDPQSKFYLPTSTQGIADISPLTYIPTLTTHSSAIWLTSEAQGSYAAENRLILHALTDRGFSATLATAYGGHDWGLWSRQLPVSLRWLGSQWSYT